VVISEIKQVKKICTVLFLITALAVNGQAFRRYEVKSGKIVYQVIRFVLHSEIHTDSNGKLIAKSEQVPYVAEIRDYYWDDYGNIYRDVIYKVSDMGGKPLPQKKKVIERLWLAGRMYYLKNGKVSFDSYHLREECMNNAPLFQKVGWFKVLHPGAKIIGKEKVAGKRGTRYYVDEFSEYVLWKGLVLSDISYFTNSKEQRKGMENKKTAVKIQIPFKTPEGFYHPKWLQQ